MCHATTNGGNAVQVILGIIVLVVGVGVLGWWGTTHQAEDMQADITERATDTLGDTAHPVDLAVSGRDIVVTGIADSDAEADAIVARLNDVNGRRVVRNDLEVLPQASPYAFTSSKSSDGQTYAGNSPSDAQSVAWGTAFGDAPQEFSVAGGMPDAAWPGVVDKGLAGLNSLKVGELSVQDRAVSLTGVAAFPQGRDAALAALGEMPEGYELTTDISVEDDGTPMRLTVRKDGGSASAVGKLPEGMDAARVSAGLGFDATDGGLVNAKIAAPMVDWSDQVDTGLGALSLLDTGTLAVADTDISLTGTATRAAKAEAEAMMAGIGGDYAVSTDIGFMDDGRPFSLEASFDGENVLSAGKLPFGMRADEIGSVTGAPVASNLVNIAEIESADGQWPGFAKSGLGALGMLKSGQLSIAGNDLTLTGVGTRAGVDAAEATLASAPEGYSVTTDLSVFDDGEAFGLTASRGDAGNTISGKVPFSMGETDLAGVGGFDATADVKVSEIDNDAMNWAAVSGLGLSALGKLKSGDLSVAENAVTLTGVGTRAQVAAADTLLDTVPEGVTVERDLAVFDDGVPASISVNTMDGTPVATGKLPFGFGDAEVDAAFGADVDTSAMTSGELVDASFGSKVNSGLDALSKLQRGTLDVGPGVYRLTGAALTPDVADAATAAMSLAPAEAQVDLTVIDDGSPFGLQATRVNGVNTVSGKVPSSLSADMLADLAGDRAALDVNVSQLDDADFAAQAKAGLAGLNNFRSGSLNVADGKIDLRGEGDRAALAAAQAAVAGFGNAGFAGDIYDDGKPFSLAATFDGENVLSSGKLPFGTDANLAADVLSAEATSNLARTAEIEDADGTWTPFATQGLTALKGLKNGQLTVNDKSMTLTGTGDRAGVAAAEAGLASVPAGFTATTDLNVFDDGMPVALNVTKGETLTASGKLPYDMSVSAVDAGLAGDVDTSAVTQGELENAAFAARATAGLAALDGLVDGSLMVTPGKTVITGTATNPAARTKALAGLAGLDGVSDDVTVLDDGRPLTLAVDFDGTAAVASGKVPSSLAAADVAKGLGDADTGAVNVSVLDDATFDAKARAGAAALAQLERGRMSIENGLMTVRGDALTPTEKASAEATLNGFGDVVQITALDDGTAPRMTVDYRKGATATLTGKTPDGVDAAGVANALGLPSVSSTATAGLVTTDQAVLDQLDGLAFVVPHVDYLTYTGGDADPIIDMGFSEGADFDTLKGQVAARFPQATMKAPPVRQPQDGDRRVGTTGFDEEYQNGQWRAVFGFTPTAEMCRTQTADLLAGNEVNFVTGKADLDPASAGTVAKLAAMMDFCLRETSLTLEVAGHTDSVGSESSNQALSEARANAVRAALLDAGLPADRMTATGYGEVQPIADNDTAEGRAANRRTEINWSE